MHDYNYFMIIFAGTFAWGDTPLLLGPHVSLYSKQASIFHKTETTIDKT